jgi:hypothetical protein
VAERRVVRAVLAAVCVCTGVTCWVALVSQAGCQLQGSCDPDERSIPGLSSEPKGPPLAPGGFPSGAGIYGDAWQSGAIDGPWLWFPGQRTYTISPQPADGGTPLPGPYEFVMYLSVDPNPWTTAGSNFAPSAGNPTEFGGLPDGGMDGFQVTNDSCSPYYLWLQATPARPATTLDAGADAHVSSDAGTDAGVSSDAQARSPSDAGND